MDNCIKTSLDEGVAAGPSRCSRCDIEGIPNPSVPNQWTCPKCGGRLVSLEVSTQIKFREALGSYGVSKGTCGELPARESTRHVSELGQASGTDVERAEDGRSTVRRLMHPSGPTPRDPSGAQKRREEIEAVEKILPVYNRLHGTEYREVVSGEDGRGVDVVAKYVGGERSIDFQVTFIDCEGRLRASISQGRPYDDELPEEALLARFAQALKKKAMAPDRDGVLVLDGRGVTTPRGTIERFVRDYRSDLGAAPFREVWYVDHAPGGIVKRIWPPEPTAELSETLSSGRE